jgi:hypothetical protein
MQRQMLLSDCRQFRPEYTKNQTYKVGHLGNSPKRSDPVFPLHVLLNRDSERFPRSLLRRASIWLRHHIVATFVLAGIFG